MDTLIKCLWQRVPIKEFIEETYGNDTFSIDNQLKIHQELDKIVKLNPYYVKLFLKSYLNKLENLNLEIDETLYEMYCHPQILNSRELNATEPDILTYIISDAIKINVKECPKLISGKGTTGLRTWEAATYMARYLNYNLPINTFENQTVCELGAGTGFVSLSLIKNHSRNNLKRIIITDGDSQLIDNLNCTFELNGIDRNCQSLSNKISCQQLLWGTTNRELTEETEFIQPVPSNVDILIGADITYDSSILKALCCTINDFLISGTKYALIAATVRNENTIKDWERELNSTFKNWGIMDVVSKPESLNSDYVWYKKGTPEIRIYKISN